MVQQRHVKLLNLCVAIVAFVLCMFCATGGLKRAHLDSNPLQLNTEIIEMGEVNAGESETAVFEVINSSKQIRTILGAKSGCGCLRIQPLPAKVPAGGKQRFSVEVLADAGIEEVTNVRYKFELLSGEAGWLQPIFVSARLKPDPESSSIQLEPIPIRP